MIATGTVTWAGCRNTYHNEGYPWLPARKGLEGRHKIFGPYGDFHAYRRKRSSRKSFHSWPLRGLQAAGSIVQAAQQTTSDTKKQCTGSKQNNRMQYGRCCTDIQQDPEHFWATGIWSKNNNHVSKSRGIIPRNSKPKPAARSSTRSVNKNTAQASKRYANRFLDRMTSGHYSMNGIQKSIPFMAFFFLLALGASQLSNHLAIAFVVQALIMPFSILPIAPFLGWLIITSAPKQLSFATWS